ncbi:MAG: hypothetical protein ACXVHV_07785, partial [Methanobacterium sp.]
MEVHKTKIILQEDNYANWKYEITMILTQRRIAKVITYESFTDYLDKNGLKYENEKMASKRMKWKEDDEAAIGFIGLSVDPIYYSTVKEAESAYQVMSKLEELFEGKNNANKFKLKEEYHNMRQKKNESLTNYLERVKLVNDKLVAVGSDPIKEYDICVKIITTLLGENTPIKMACLMLKEEELTLNYLRQRFAMEMPNGNTRLNGVSINYINNNNNKNGCYKCGMTNHKAKFCRSPQWKIDEYNNIRNNNNNNNNNNNIYNNNNGNRNFRYNNNGNNSNNRNNGNNNNNNNNNKNNTNQKHTVAAKSSST